MTNHTSGTHVGSIRRRLATLVLVSSIGLVPPAPARPVDGPAGDDGGGLAIRAEVVAGPRSEPLVRVFAKNASSARLTVPGLDSFVVADSVETGPYRRSPLVVEPEEEPSHGWTYSIEQPAKPERPRSPGSVMTIEPGEERLLGEVPFAERVVERDGGVSTTRYFFEPGRTHRVRLRFENRQAKRDGVALWTGSARTEPVELSLAPASVAGAAVTGSFTAERDTYVVGEPIYVTFEVRNDGTTPVVFPVGGDYRMTGRQERFRFSAKDADGRPVVDPLAGSPEAGVPGGGIGSGWRLRPGERQTERVLVNPWCRFDAPGTYTVTARRVLRLHAPERKDDPEEYGQQVTIESELTITLVADDGRLAAVYDDLFAERDFRTLSWLASPALESRMLDALGDPRWSRYETTILDGLRHMGPESYRKGVVRALDLGESAPGLALSAAAAARELGLPDVTPRLERLLTNPDDSVKAGALLELTRSDPASLTVDEVEPFTRSSNGILKRYATAALGAVRGDDDRVVALLVRAVREPVVLADREEDDFVKIWAATELQKRGHTEGVPVLIEMLKRKTDYAGNVLGVLEAAAGRKIRPTYADWKRWWRTEGSRRVVDTK